MVERLLGGVETAVLETRKVAAADVAFGAMAEVLTAPEEVEESAAELELELEESLTEAPTILKGKDHWKTEGSSSQIS